MCCRQGVCCLLTLGAGAGLRERSQTPLKEAIRLCCLCIPLSIGTGLREQQAQVCRATAARRWAGFGLQACIRLTSDWSRGTAATTGSLLPKVERERGGVAVPCPHAAQCAAAHCGYLCRCRTHSCRSCLWACLVQWMRRRASSPPPTCTPATRRRGSSGGEPAALALLARDTIWQLARPAVPGNAPCGVSTCMARAAWSRCLF